MINTRDLEQHISITSAHLIKKIIRPLRESFDIAFFRYLKLYKSGSRVVLSNLPDAIRYIYGEGNHVHMWFDGNYSEYLKPGWYTWHMNLLLDNREIGNKIHEDLTNLLSVCHGITFVQEYQDHYEIFSFDANGKEIYGIDKSLLLRFAFYFKEQAHKLIEIGEQNSLFIPVPKKIETNNKIKTLINFLDNTKINRFYIGGQKCNTYLTAKEAVCARWLLDGKSAEEIALIEGISTKTAQRHLENIKNKFNYSKQTQLIHMLLKSSLHEQIIFEK